MKPPQQEQKSSIASKDEGNNNNSKTDNEYHCNKGIFVDQFNDILFARTSSSDAPVTVFFLSDSQFVNNKTMSKNLKSTGRRVDCCSSIAAVAACDKQDDNHHYHAVGQKPRRTPVLEAG
jgi:hypothetical protein